MQPTAVNLCVKRPMHVNGTVLLWVCKTSHCNCVTNECRQWTRFDVDFRHSNRRLWTDNTKQTVEYRSMFKKYIYTVFQKKLVHQALKEKRAQPDVPVKDRALRPHPDASLVMRSVVSTAQSRLIT